MYSIKKNYIYLIALVVALVAGGYIDFNFDPATHHYPQCPTYRYLNFYCPGCGSQRAIHQLLHCNFAGAFRANALFLFAIPYVAVGFVFENQNIRNKYPYLRKLLFGQRAILIILCILVAYTVFRNIVN